MKIYIALYFLCKVILKIVDCGFQISDLLYRFALPFFIKLIEFLESAIRNLIFFYHDDFSNNSSRRQGYKDGR